MKQNTIMRARDNKSDSTGMRQIRNINSSKHDFNHKPSEIIFNRNNDNDISMEDMYNIEFSHIKHPVKKTNRNYCNEDYDINSDIPAFVSDKYTAFINTEVEERNFRNLGGEEDEIQIIYKGE